MRLTEEKTFKFGFYCLNALICIYSLYMFVIQNGAPNESEVLFCCWCNYVLFEKKKLVFKES